MKVTDDNLIKVAGAIKKSWNCNTSYYDWWTEDNPAEGQCAVTALVVQNFFGGFILKGWDYGGVINGSHYWNILLTGKAVDLTKGQFAGPMNLEGIKVVDRIDLLQDDFTRKRYFILKERVKKEVKKDANKSKGFAEEWSLEVPPQ